MGRLRPRVNCSITRRRLFHARITGAASAVISTIALTTTNDYVPKGSSFMIKTRVFEVLEERGQKQRWLLAELERRGYRVSEGYLSQIKAGAKQPGRPVVDALCDAIGMAEQGVVFSEGGDGAMPKHEAPQNRKQPSEP